MTAREREAQRGAGGAGGAGGTGGTGGAGWMAVDSRTGSHTIFAFSSHAGVIQLYRY